MRSSKCDIGVGLNNIGIVDLVVVNPDNGGETLAKALWMTQTQVHQMGEFDRTTKQFKNTPVKGVKEAVGFAKSRSEKGVDVYLACAEYKTGDSRQAANVAGAYAFWMDLDCGEGKAADGKGYLTVDEALKAIRGFCTQTGLPQSTHIVLSGGGVHAYWVVDGLIEREKWQANADMLKALSKARGLLVDGCRTADIASVMRMPDTLNYKYAPPRPVVLHYVADELILQWVMLTAINSAYERFCVVAVAPPVTMVNPNQSPAASNDAYFLPPDMTRLSSAYRSLTPDCDERTWALHRLAPAAREARNHPYLADRLYELARSWSSGELRGKEARAWNTTGSNGLTGRQYFEVLWKRFLTQTYTGKEATLGTVYFHARAAGWVSPKPDDGEGWTP